MTPSSDSSPRMHTRSSRSEGIRPCAASTPIAIARSNDEPAFRRCAGDRFTVMRVCGHGSPLATIADRTRSRASWIEGSGKPTMLHAGNPGLIDTSTSMGCPSIPMIATDETLAIACDVILRRYKSSMAESSARTRRVSRTRCTSKDFCDEPLNRGSSHVVRPQSCSLRDLRKHSRTDLLGIVECKYEVVPTCPDEYPMGAALTFDAPPDPQEGCKYDRALVLGHDVTPLRT